MVRDGDGIFYQVFNCQVIEFYLPVAAKMFEMRLYNRCTLFYNIFHDGLLIVGYSLPLDDAYRSFGACADAGSETIAEEIAYEPGLPIDDLKGTLRAVRDTLAASRALVIVNTDYFTFHSITPSITALSLIARTPCSPVYRRGYCRSSISAPIA